jgi:histidinol-phosphate/aromatic aminotransferase/cobyric acid decarboxylase-like protein
MAESNAHLAARLQAQRPPHPTPTASNALVVAAAAADGEQAKI